MRLPRKLKKRQKKANEIRLKKENALKAIQTMALLASMRNSAIILQSSPNISREVKALRMVEIMADFMAGLQKIFS